MSALSHPIVFPTRSSATRTGPLVAAAAAVRTAFHRAKNPRLRSPPGPPLDYKFLSVNLRIRVVTMSRATATKHESTAIVCLANKSTANCVI